MFLKTSKLTMSFFSKKNFSNLESTLYGKVLSLGDSFKTHFEVNSLCSTYKKNDNIFRDFKVVGSRLFDQRQMAFGGRKIKFCCFPILNTINFK